MGLAAGVPMVVVPLLADQPYNAARRDEWAAREHSPLALAMTAYAPLGRTSFRTFPVAPVGPVLLVVRT